ncbi:A-kinase anchor protein 10, mitochondrial-like [Lytechinus pictus]|uniref:A-kinase anchor protein 10, mitochondrial-like n=1 Tax=Lytechinus pictus TaxID=7653 RepID=UPI0030BA10DD
MSNMPLFKRKSEKRGQQPTVRQTSQHGSPPGKASHPHQKAQNQQHVQQLKTSPQHAGQSSLNYNQSGQPGARPGAPDGDSRKVEKIDDGTAALAASRRLRGGQIAEGAQVMSDDSDALGDLGTGLGKIETSDQAINRSRLCKSMNEVLHDNGALPYFIQYMASSNSKQLVQFWLAAESFSNASWSKMRTDSMTKGDSPVIGNHVTTTIPEERRENVEQTKSQETNSSVTNNKETICSSSDTVESDSINTTNNNVDLPSLDETDSSKKDTQSVPVVVVNPPVSMPKKNDSPSISPQKTHTRAMSDSAVGVGKMFGSGATFQPGHRRNNSWKEVDPRTAVERDAINIFTRYICKDATSPIGVPEDIRLDIIAKICPKDGQFDPDSFKAAQNYAFSVMEKQYFQSFLMSEFHCKYQIDVLTSGRVYLADILYNDVATFYFMEYLEQENAVHLLQFWLAGENFQQHLLSQQGQYDPMEAQNDAMVLYDKYFSLQATSPLGFDDKIRFEVESNICREGGPLATCFSTPMRQTYTTLETMHFPGFLRSELYYKFLNELISNIKSEHGTMAAAGSVATALEDDQSSVSSEPATRGMRNTLLAEGNVVKLFDGDLSIDQLKFDPDTLWQRPSAGNAGMMFGKVNHLGQFVPEYEPDPESLQKRASSNKFSLKKLVTKEEDKSKEEMALKIAQMIINDVNKQTQGLAGDDIPSPTAAKPPQRL